MTAVAGVRMWAIAIGLGSTLHFWLLAFTLLVQRQPTLDSVNATAPMGLPWQVAAVPGLLLGACVTWFLTRRTVQGEGNGAALAVVLGVLTGSILWLAVLGPRVLPLPS